MKWLKRIFYTCLVLVLAGGALLVGANELRKRKPDWYPASLPNPAAVAAAASSVEKKFTGIQSWVASSHAKSVRGDKGTTGPIGDTDAEPESSKVISLTEDELNAFFAKWDESLKWSGKYDAHVTNPMLILQDDRLILAATVKDADTLVSLHLEPKLDERGMLRLRLVRVMGGRLPLPQVFWDRYRSTVTRMMVNKLDVLRDKAEIAADGTANAAAVGTAINRLLLHSVNDQPAEPVLFLPHGASPKEGFPVKLTQVAIKGKVFTMTVVPMNAAERKELIGRLRSAYPTDKQAVVVAGEGRAEKPGR